MRKNSVDALVQARWKLCAQEFGFPETWAIYHTPHQGWRVENRDARPGQARYPLGNCFIKGVVFIEALTFAISISWARKQAAWPDALQEPEPEPEPTMTDVAAAMFRVPRRHVTPEMLEYAHSCMMQKPAPLSARQDDPDAALGEVSQQDAANRIGW